MNKFRRCDAGVRKIWSPSTVAVVAVDQALASSSRRFPLMRDSVTVASEMHVPVTLSLLFLAIGLLFVPLHRSPLFLLYRSKSRISSPLCLPRTTFTCTRGSRITYTATGLLVLGPRLTCLDAMERRHLLRYHRYCTDVTDILWLIIPLKLDYHAAEQMQQRCEPHL